MELKSLLKLYYWLVYGMKQESLQSWKYYFLSNIVLHDSH